MPGYEDVPAQGWQAWVKANDAVILDVREPDEWELGTLPEAVRLAMSELMERFDEVPAGRPILCVCRSGDRSGQVAAYLALQGFEVANLAGGMKALGLQD